jgi:hypothetical protein
MPESSSSEDAVFDCFLAFFVSGECCPGFHRSEDDSESSSSEDAVFDCSLLDLCFRRVFRPRLSVQVRRRFRILFPKTLALTASFWSLRLVASPRLLVQVRRQSESSSTEDVGFDCFLPPLRFSSRFFRHLLLLPLGLGAPHDTNGYSMIPVSSLVSIETVSAISISSCFNVMLSSSVRRIVVYLVAFLVIRPDLIRHGGE